MKRLLLIFSIAAGLTLTGCGSEESGHSHGEGSDHTHSQETHQDATGDQSQASHQHENEETHSHTGETDHEDAHSHEGEESGMELGLGETYDEVRRGVRLVLSYNSDTDTFSGTVKNTTQEALPQVSVGVQLSNGTELRPTSPVDLDPGESQSIELDATGETFDSWSTHSEIGSGGHSHGEDGEHTHNK